MVNPRLSLLRWFAPLQLYRRYSARTWAMNSAGGILLVCNLLRCCGESFSSCTIELGLLACNSFRQRPEMLTGGRQGPGTCTSSPSSHNQRRCSCTRFLASGSLVFAAVRGLYPSFPSSAFFVGVPPGHASHECEQRASCRPDGGPCPHRVVRSLVEPWFGGGLDALQHSPHLRHKTKLRLLTLSAHANQH